MTTKLQTKRDKKISVCEIKASIKTVSIKNLKKIFIKKDWKIEHLSMKCFDF